ncbi:hypothetical protein [Cyanophage S-TIM5]|uniref:Uncharacterized protein n=1 Tax=Cyanophage S-TIM5 TaxID=1137745 RepID=H6WG33_9CAUD|nr:hypothetical protein F417_gp052 [Cyanophage S-TIM5]AEZ65760.1 hypothetical protein [Cyanophage S-TIM5]UYE96928.1 hypothetical protein [Cyanophage S-TIM66]UYE97139.1 hypothetical protein [Cyanophage S-TIM61]UYE97344.1 hypothetical protein [Cyanophage S-TIM54]
MLAVLLPFAKSIVLKAVESEQVKYLVVEILKRIVSRTDNDLDDLVVEQLEIALFPKPAEAPAEAE